MGNILGTSFAQSGFTVDQNFSPANAAFAAAVRAVMAQAGIAPPYITINAPLTVNGIGKFNVPDNVEALELHDNGPYSSGIYLGFSAPLGLYSFLGIGSIAGLGAGATSLSLINNAGNVTTAGDIRFGSAPQGIIMTLAAAGNVTIAAPASGTTLTANGIALGGTTGNQSTVAAFHYSSSNDDQLNITGYRATTGGDWTHAQTRLQKIVDVTQQGFIYFGDGGTSTAAGTNGMILGSQGNNAIFINGTANVTVGPPSSGTPFTVNGSNVLGGIVATTASGGQFVGLAINQTAATGFGEMTMSCNATQKIFRVGSTGTYDIVNNANSAVLFSITDGGNTTITAGSANHLTIAEGGGIPTIALAAGGGTGAGVKFLGSSAAQGKNWLIGNQYNVSGQLEFTPSTAAGGSTFTTPVWSLGSGGQFTGTIATGNSAVSATMSDGTGAFIAKAANGIQISGFEMAQTGQSSWLWYNPGGSNTSYLYNSNTGNTIQMDNTGAVTISGANNGLSLTVNGGTGTSGNAALTIAGVNVAGSRGLDIKAGQVNTTDYALLVRDYAATNNLMLVQTNGSTTLSGVGGTTLTVNGVAGNFIANFSAPTTNTCYLEMSNVTTGELTRLYADNSKNFYVSTNAGTNQSLACSPVSGGIGPVAFPSITTTASAANAFLNSGSSPANSILRSTSSLRYKTNIVDLPDPHAILMGLRPVTYTSLSSADDPTTVHIGLIAEEVDLLDTRLVHRSRVKIGTQQVKIDDITTQIQDVFDPVATQPESVQYERLTVLMLAYIQKLEARLTAAGIK